ncbi:MAG: hypothetical protein WC421_03085 [Elusimicrobiales bacterium]
MGRILTAFFFMLALAASARCEGAIATLVFYSDSRTGEPPAVVGAAVSGDNGGGEEGFAAAAAGGAAQSVFQEAFEGARADMKSCRVNAGGRGYYKASCLNPIISGMVRLAAREFPLYAGLIPGQIRSKLNSCAARTTSAGGERYYDAGCVNSGVDELAGMIE